MYGKMCDNGHEVFAAVQHTLLIEQEVYNEVHEGRTIRHTSFFAFFAARL